MKHLDLPWDKIIFCRFWKQHQQFLTLPSKTIKRCDYLNLFIRSCSDFFANKMSCMVSTSSLLMILSLPHKFFPHKVSEKKWRARTCISAFVTAYQRYRNNDLPLSPGAGRNPKIDTGRSGTFIFMQIIRSFHITFGVTLFLCVGCIWVKIYHVGWNKCF